MANNTYNLKFEDTIQCSFYSTSSAELDALCKALNKTVADLSKDYIWHRDKFKICISVFDREAIDMPTHLTSTTCFGDNIEDEWFIVYLVLQITSQYPDLLVKLEDNDGDFLLIEAADFLPSWANPDTTKNRVFIYQGKIHLIPPEVVGLDSKLDLQDAINLVVRKTDETKTTTEIQDAILRKTIFYPQKIKESQHLASVTLPIDIAALLTLKPCLISPIVQAFCNHDMLDAKWFKNVKFEHCVTIPLLFTKYLFAMLMHSKLPGISKCSSSSENNKEIALGRKLAYGYEIIMSKSSNDIFSSTEYHKFIRSLTKNGYFRDNIEGSKHYNELLEEARAYFSNVECTISSYYCNNISELKSTEEFKNIRHSLKNIDSQSNVAADDAKWLNINPDELNTFLNTQYGKKIFKSHVTTTSQITSELSNFLEKTSDFEGIEYIEKDEVDSDKIEFDSDEFISSIEKMLSLVSGKNREKEDYDSEFSEGDDDSVDFEETLDKEIATKLQKSDSNNCKDENIVKNLLQSIQDEGISGPSSNILKCIDVSKIEFLDSDDE